MSEIDYQGIRYMKDRKKYFSSLIANGLFGQKTPEEMSGTYLKPAEEIQQDLNLARKLIFAQGGLGALKDLGSLVEVIRVTENRELMLEGNPEVDEIVLVQARRNYFKSLFVMGLVDRNTGRLRDPARFSDDDLREFCQTYGKSMEEVEQDWEIVDRYVERRGGGFDLLLAVGFYEDIQISPQKRNPIVRGLKKLASKLQLKAKYT